MLKYTSQASVAQLAEQHIRNVQVVGSSPTGSSKFLGLEIVNFRVFLVVYCLFDKRAFADAGQRIDKNTERRVNMDTEQRIKNAVENQKKGYNCAQAVACAFCDLFGVEEKEAYKAMEGFGGGMGVMSTCGAVSAMVYLAGLANSDGDISAPGKTKPTTMKHVKPMINEFNEKNSSIICRELKGVDTGKVLRSCPGCIEDGARIAAKYLLSEE